MRDLVSAAMVVVGAALIGVACGGATVTPQVVTDIGAGLKLVECVVEHESEPLPQVAADCKSDEASVASAILTARRVTARHAACAPAVSR